MCAGLRSDLRKKQALLGTLSRTLKAPQDGTVGTDLLCTTGSATFQLL